MKFDPELPGGQSKKGKRVTECLLSDRKEEMNHMLIGDKPVLAKNSEENGSRGIADGAPEGQTDTDPPLHGHRSLLAYTECDHTY